MRGLIDPNSKLFALLTKAVLLMELNLLVLLCCLPLVTIGAAMASMHTVLLKIYRDEEKKVAADFFQAMKSNLKNATILWLLFWGYLSMLTGMWMVAAFLFPAFKLPMLLILLPAVVSGILCLNWALILQSRYVYTVRQCLKNAVLAWAKYPGSTFVYLVSIAVPVALCFSMQLWPIVILIGITAPHMMSTSLYSRLFDDMEGVPMTMPKL